MWLIPVLLIGVIVVAATSKSPRESRPPSRQLARAPAPATCQLVPATGPPALPGPISVLGEILRVGQYPSPMVVLCAIAEAEAIGRRDLASDIVSAFVAPVVHQHRALRGRACGPLHVPAPYERGSCALSCGPRAQADHERTSCAPRYGRGTCETSASAAPVPVPAPAGGPQDIDRQPTEDEILSMLHADPQAFISMVEAQQARRGPLVEVFPVGTRPPVSATDQTLPVPESAGPYATVDQSQVKAPGSPLGSVPDEAWLQFVGCLKRESPTFSSSRHVGQYRQRRERLVDLGIDPSALQGSATAQRTALDADLADAYRHADAGGLTGCLGRPITVPGQEGAQLITLSGLLGVIQCAGLEGAVGWLERSSDRKRYPHTTQVFLNTNGVF